MRVGHGGLDPRATALGIAEQSRAQSEAQLAAGRTQLLTAEANLTTTRGNFRRIIGNEPQALAPGSPVDRYLPATLPAAIELGLTQNPNVTAAMFGIEVVAGLAAGSASLQADALDKLPG